MSLRLYSGDRVWLVVPDCILAPRAAIHRYGSLSFVGEVDEARLSRTELAKIMAGLDANLFAEIPEKAANRLLAGSEA